MAHERTIPRLWQDGVARGRSRPAYLFQHHDHWYEVSWADAATRVGALANGLLARGVRKGDVFGILARTTLEWALFDFALAHVGAVTAPVYHTSAPKDVEYVLSHSGSIGVLCEDEEQLAKVEDARERLPELRELLTFAGLPELEADGRQYAAANPQALEDAVDAVGPDDLFTFIYTSGTTGLPKGCMILHRNYYEMVAVVDGLPDYASDEDLTLLYLPLAHNFGRLLHLAGPYVGYTTAFLPDPLTIADAMQQLKPTILPSVPRVYEKVHTAVVSAFDEATGLRRRIVSWALGVGRRASAVRQEHRPLPRSLAVQHAIADRLVFSHVRERLGGRLRTPISGGAPLAREIAEFFDALGIRILEGYGLTECTSAATTNTPDRYRFGTVGTALPGFELRLEDDGELLMRSETIFAGYHRDPEATAAVLLEDGWLRSGDIAEIDEDGFVCITDRKKDIIVTAGGKNVAPQNIENELKASRFVSQSLVVGDRRPYITALITLDPVEIGKWAEANEVALPAGSETSGERVQALVQEIVDGVNAERSGFEQVKRFAILPRDFTIEDGEVTPTLKLRRRVVLEHFADVVEQMYAARPT